MKKTLFDKLYAAGTEVVQAIKKPNLIRMQKRAAERSADKLDRKKIDAEVRRTELESQLVNCEDEDEMAELYEQIAAIDREIEIAQKLSDSINAEYAKLFAEVDDEGKTA
jgi:hypothetical protein